MFKRLAVGLGALVLSLSALGAPALAANTGSNPGISQKVAPCDWSYPTRCQKVNADGSLNVSGTITASLGAFNPVASTSLAVTSTTARVAFPSADASVLIRNTSTADAYLVFGTNTVVATTGTGTLLPAGQAVAYAVGTATNVAAITASGTTSLAITTGTGLPALTGGGGGTGGGGAITAAASSYAAGAFSAGAGVDGWDLTQGAKGDSAYAGSGSASMVAILKGLYAAVSGPIPTQAGTVIIGGVGIDQTTAGTTNGVVNKAAAVGGSTPSLAAALSTTVTAIKASAGSLYLVQCYNPNATVAYAQVFNIASGSVTLGTSTPLLSVPIPATSNGGFAMSTVPVAFGTAMSWAATTTATGSTAPGTALTCNAAYN